jgi:cytochrome c oxidase assembly protein subunit 11
MAAPSRQRRNLNLLMVLVGVVAAMTGLSFAAVPLYRIFCAATGFGGTPQRAEQAPTEISDRVVTVTFTADIAKGLGWRFQPMQRSTEVRVGETKLAYFVAENLESRPVTGRAVFNVSPDLYGAYFNKIECFCFTEQTLQPGQRVEMPVSFFIDPAMLKDPELKSLNDITLSYTFFRAEDDGKNAEQKVGQAENSQAGAGQPEPLN